MTDRLAANLAHLAPRYPAFAKKLSLSCEESQWHLCETKEGEPNLRHRAGWFLHSPEGAREEALAWQKERAFSEIEVFFVYGVGLGYFFEAFTNWLQESPKRQLVLIEDDWEVARYFLETEVATEALTHPQVHFLPYLFGGRENFYSNYLNVQCNQWANLRENAVAIPSYEEHREEGFSFLCRDLFSFLEQKSRILMDSLGSTPEVMRNYYHNLPLFGSLSSGEDLFGQFAGVPAIICGAGPSLFEEMELLRGLLDRALVFGAGTGMNVLHAHGIFPHFGMLLDPTVTQASRISESFAFETPYFVSLRATHEALVAHHGPQLYYSLPDVGFSYAAEQKLGIPNDNPLTVFCSTPYGCLALARALGCGPLIFVGMNLAFSETKHYSPGVRSHPVEARQEMGRGEDSAQKTMELPGTDGELVITTTLWANEAKTYGEFARSYPDTTCINATRGGLLIEKFLSLSLTEVAERYLTRSYPIREWVGAEVARSKTLAVSSSAARGVLEAWQEELEEAEEKLSLLEQELPEWKRGLVELELQELSVGASLLEEYRPVLPILCSNLETYREDAARLLKTFVQQEQKTVAESLSAFPEDWVSKSGKPGEEKGTYLFDGHCLKVEDEELDLSLEEPFSPMRIAQVEDEAPEKQPLESAVVQGDILEGECVRYYPTGEVKWRGYYKEGQLHGPACCFGKEGQLLVKALFFHGKRVGRSRCCDLEGNLLSEQCFSDGVWDGVQSYYYPTGVIKSRIGYEKGKLHGMTTLYSEEGQKKRELFFRDGYLEGKARQWNRAGLLVEESEYRKNQFVGESLRWHPNGALASRALFYDSSQHYDLYFWDKEGSLVEKELFVPEKIGAFILRQLARVRAPLWRLKMGVSNANEQRKDSKKPC